jgi:hypothetical protein
MVGSKYGKYALEALVLFGLIFGAYKWAERRGREAQRDKDNQVQSLEIEKSRVEASGLKDRLVQQANASASAAEQRAQVAQQQFNVLAGVLSNLDTKARQGQEQVSKLADSELHADITAKLSIRKPGDVTPGYYVQEERSIDNTVTQYPIEVERGKTLAEEVQQKDAEARANKDAADARGQAFKADEDYITLLNKYYAALFNQHAPHKRGGKCLFLWGCGRITVTPEPPKKGSQ